MTMDRCQLALSRGAFGIQQDMRQHKVAALETVVIVEQEVGGALKRQRPVDGQHSYSKT